MADTVENLLVGEHRIDQTVLNSLTVEDVRRVLAAVRDRQDPYRARAMDVLVTLGDASALATVSEVLLDTDEALDMRMSAAGQLGRMGMGEAEGALLAALSGSREPALTIEIAEALGTIGGTRSLEALGSIVSTSEGALREQSLLARFLIACRLGLTGLEPPVPSSDQVLALDEDRARPFTIGRAPVREAAAALSSLARANYGLRLSRALLFYIECGAQQYVLALDAQWIGGGLADLARNRPLHLGIIASRAPVDGSYSVRWLLLTWPSDEGRANIAAYRPTGKQVLFGAAREDGGNLVFALDAVQADSGANVAIRVEGRVEGSRIDFVKAVAGRDRSGTRSPRRIEPPERAALFTLDLP